jgi:hypothetical protein
MDSLLKLARRVLPYAVAALAAEHYLRGIAEQMISVRPDIIDFGVYFHAAQAFAAGHHIYPAYSGCCFDQGAMDGYTYPPVLAVALSPLAGVPIGVMGRIFLGFSQLCLVGALLVMHVTVRSSLSRRTEVWLLAAVLLFQPIHAGNYALQIENLLLLLFAVAAWAYVHERGGALGGVALGVGAALKVAPGLMLVPLLMDRPRRAAMSLAGFVVAAAIPLLLVWTVATETPSYFTDVLPRFAGGVASQYNRSLPGVILRTYTSTGHTPAQLWSTVFHALQLGGLAATWLWCRRSVSTPAGRAATFAAFLALMPITQAVTWDHHMASDALAFVLLAVSLRRATLTWWAAVAGMAIMSVNQLELTSMLQRAGLDPPPHGVGVVAFVAGASVNLVGMILLYGAALSVAREHRRAAAPAPLPSHGRPALVASAAR